MKKTDNLSGKVAYSGIITGVSVVLMVCSSFIPIGKYAFPAIAGALICLIVIEFGKIWAWSAYIAVSLVSIILCADKQIAVYFIVFFGCYPILKAIFERIKNKYISTVVKFTMFNASAIAVYYIFSYIFNITLENIKIYNINIVVVLFVVGNIAFIIYDICLSKAINIYINKYRKIINKYM